MQCQRVLDGETDGMLEAADLGIDYRGDAGSGSPASSGFSVVPTTSMK
jgi:hypothetical protein